MPRPRRSVGIGMAPGGNLSDEVALFEATHGTAPKYTDQDVVNPGSLILSAVMLLEHIGWQEAAALILSGLEKTILQKKVTYDLGASHGRRDEGPHLRVRRSDHRKLPIEALPRAHSKGTAYVLKNETDSRGGCVDGYRHRYRS